MTTSELKSKLKDPHISDGVILPCCRLALEQLHKPLDRVKCVAMIFRYRPHLGDEILKRRAPELLEQLNTELRLNEPRLHFLEAIVFQAMIVDAEEERRDYLVFFAVMKKIKQNAPKSSRYLERKMNRPIRAFLVPSPVAAP